MTVLCLTKGGYCDCNLIRNSAGFVFSLNSAHKGLPHVLAPLLLFIVLLAFLFSDRT